MIGDFNCIRNDGERIGGQPRSRIMMEEFNKCIDMCSAVELKTFGCNITWTNGQEGRNRQLVKLDWTLVNLHFLHNFKSARVDHLARKSFDHKPMLLSLASPTSCYKICGLLMRIFLFL